MDATDGGAEERDISKSRRVLCQGGGVAGVSPFINLLTRDLLVI